MCEKQHRVVKTEIDIVIFSDRLNAVTYAGDSLSAQIWVSSKGYIKSRHKDRGRRRLFVVNCLSLDML